MVYDILKKLRKLNVTGLSDDTRYLGAGEAFICLNGKDYSGIDFIDEAIAKGAKAIITDQKIEDTRIPIIMINNIEKALSELLSKYYDYPDRELRLIGITGTDGKTTTASFIEYFLNLKYKCCYIGTNGVRYLSYRYKSYYTTLPLCLFIKILRKVANKNIRYVSMEVSSQGLIDGRLKGIEFDCAIFTNLSHEHLDTHKNMNDYFKAKQQLFKQVDSDGVVITNIDDEYGRKIKHKNLITYGITRKADYQIINIRESRKHLTFDLKTPSDTYFNLKVPFLEKYNLYNLLAAICCSLYYNISIKDIIKSLNNLPKIEGRMELITTDEDFKVYVDFAHTPNALSKVLEHLRTTTSKRIILVLGCAGEKDHLKRPLMGDIALQKADYVFLTSEDPRSENPLDIIKEMLSTTTTNNYEIELDRRVAIQKAIECASTNDVVIITGKGNDDYFETENEIYQYSDISEVIKTLKMLKNN